VLHYLRVNVTGNRLEVTAVRADGTTIESTSWIDGPAPTEPLAAKPATRATGAAKEAPAITPVLHSGTRSLAWLGIAGLVLALGAAVVVVRMLRS
jgi:hypothetical protein